MRRPHLLRPNHKNEKPDRIIFFDSESRVQMKVTDDEIRRLLCGEKVEKPHDPYLVCATFVRRANNGKMKEETRDYHGKDFLRRFWRDVDAFCPWRKRLYMVAHNAKYDVLVTRCIPYLVEMGYKVLMFSDSNPFILRLQKSRPKLDKNGDIVRNEDGEIVYDRKTIIIFSSTNYYQTSLEALGKTFGIEKGTHDHEVGDGDLEHAIEYCRRDVEILKTAVTAFIDFVQTEDLGNFAMTVAGQAFNAYRHRFMGFPIYIHDNLKAIKMEREAYAGGRNECFHIGRVPASEVYGCDVNSMYPSVMREHVYPTRLVAVRSLPRMKEIEKWLEDGYLLVGECYVDTDVPIFHKKLEKLVFPVGRYWTTLCTPEIIEGLRRGLIKKVRKVAVYEGAPIFREYVEYFYGKRLEAKASGDRVRDLLYKLFLNSLYGKFGQKAEHWEKVDDATDPNMMRVEIVYDWDTGKKCMEKVVGGGVFRKKHDPEDNESWNSFPAIAAHVTAYARMRLWTYIETAGLENVYYCDTDSIYCSIEGFRRLERAGLIDDRELGLLKLERVCREFTLYGCKDYEFVDVKTGERKVKMKGVSKGAIPIEPDDEGHPRYVVVQWCGMSDGLRRGNMDVYANRLVIKTLRREYDKGVVTPSGRVEPYWLDEPVQSERVVRILEEYRRMYA